MSEENINENINNDTTQEATVNSQEIRQAKKLHRERKVIKGRLKQSRLKAFIRFLISVALIGLIFLTSKLNGIYFDGDAFKLSKSESVEILNNKIIPTTKIYSVLKTIEMPKTCIFFLRTGEIKKKLYLLKPVEKVYIRRYAFPARIQIIIRESAPAIIVTNDLKEKPLAYFTVGGKIVSREYLPLPSDMNALTVLTKGGSWTKWDKDEQQRLLKIAKYIETFSKEPVEYIDYRNPDDVYVKVKTVNIRLGLPDDSIWLKMERLPSIMPQLKYVNSKIKYLDLSWEKVNYLKLD